MPIDFGKWAFFTALFQSILANPTIFNKWSFCGVTTLVLYAPSTDYLFQSKHFFGQFHCDTHAVSHRKGMRPVMVSHRAVTFANSQGETNKGV